MKAYDPAKSDEEKEGSLVSLTVKGRKERSLRRKKSKTLEIEEERMKRKLVRKKKVSLTNKNKIIVNLRRNRIKTQWYPNTPL